MHRRACPLMIVFLLISSQAVRAATHRVPGQYSTIQAALDAASGGDSVLVAPGIYAAYEARSPWGVAVTACVFMKSGVVLLSEEGAEVTTIECNDVWSDTREAYGGENPDATGTNGNISADPFFCRPVDEDFTLRSDSPCLPGNHPEGADCGLLGAREEGCSAPTPVRFTSWGRIKAGYR